MPRTVTVVPTSPRLGVTSVMFGRTVKRVKAVPPDPSAALTRCVPAWAGGNRTVQAGKLPWESVVHEEVGVSVRSGRDRVMDELLAKPVPERTNGAPTGPLAGEDRRSCGTTLIEVRALLREPSVAVTS